MLKTPHLKLKIKIYLKISVRSAHGSVLMLFQRPRRFAPHALHAEEQGGGGFKRAFESANHEWLSVGDMTRVVKHIRNLPFIQGLLHGSSLWRALQVPPPSGRGGAPLGQINSPFTAAKRHGLNCDYSWCFTPVFLKKSGTKASTLEILAYS